MEESSSYQKDTVNMVGQMFIFLLYAINKTRYMYIFHTTTEALLNEKMTHTTHIYIWEIKNVQNRGDKKSITMRDKQNQQKYLQSCAKYHQFHSVTVLKLQLSNWEKTFKILMDCQN